MDLSHPPVTAVISKNAGLYSGIVISAVNTFWKSGSSKTTGIKKKILDFLCAVAKNLLGFLSLSKAYLSASFCYVQYSCHRETACMSITEAGLLVNTQP